MGVCGSCGMLINGRPRLACNTQVGELGSRLVIVAPLPNFNIIRDLVPDLVPMFEAHVRMQPFMIRGDARGAARADGGVRAVGGANWSTTSSSGTASSAAAAWPPAPPMRPIPAYSGPMPLAQAHRYNADTRDGGFEASKAVLAGHAGPWKCHFAGECSRACPKGVDPAQAIQLMKRDLVRDYLRCSEGAARRLWRPSPSASSACRTSRRPRRRPSRAVDVAQPTRP